MCQFAVLEFYEAAKKRGCNRQRFNYVFINVAHLLYIKTYYKFNDNTNVDIVRCCFLFVYYLYILFSHHRDKQQFANKTYICKNSEFSTSFSLFFTQHIIPANVYADFQIIQLARFTHLKYFQQHFYVKSSYTKRFSNRCHKNYA